MGKLDLLKMAGFSVLETMADNAMDISQKRSRNKEFSEDERNEYADKFNQYKYAKEYFGDLKDELQEKKRLREMEEEQEQREEDRFRKLYEKAVKNQDIDAQYNLAICYDNGEGVEKDEVEAVKWYRKAAEQGHKDAQFDLGVSYDNGEGIEKDENEAVRWYRKAAEQGHVAAQYNLAVCYDNGEGIEKDEDEAVKWYRKAAEQGHKDAKYNLKIYQKKLNEEESLLNTKITENDKKLITDKNLWLTFSENTTPMYDKELRNIGIIILEVEHKIVYIVRAIDLKHGGILKEINKILDGNVKKIEKRVNQNRENMSIKFLPVSSSINDIGRISLLEKMLIAQYHPEWN